MILTQCSHTAISARGHTVTDHAEQSGLRDLVRKSWAPTNRQPGYNRKSENREIDRVRPVQTRTSIPAAGGELQPKPDRPAPRSLEILKVIVVNKIVYQMVYCFVHGSGEHLLRGNACETGLPSGSDGLAGFVALRPNNFVQPH